MASRDVAQLGSASALGAEGRRFESCHPDHFSTVERVINKGFEAISDERPFFSLKTAKSDILRQSRTKLGHFISVAEAAKKAHVSDKTIKRWCESGKLPAIPKAFGKHITYQISPQALDMMLKDVEEQERIAQKEAVDLKKPHFDYVKAWKQAMAKGLMNGKVYSQRTMDDYSRYIELFFKKQKAITATSLQKELLQVPSEQFAKREHYYKAVLCFARFLIQQKALDGQFIKDINPLYPKRHLPPKRLMIAVDDAEKLMKACQTPEERLILTLFMDTGLRVAEACSLAWADVNLNQGYLIVRCGKGGKERRVGLSKRLIDTFVEFKNELKTSRVLVFVNTRKKKMIPSGLFQRLERIGKTAKVKVNPHALRRYFVTTNANKGRSLVILQRSCGHSDIKTTMGYCLTSEQEVVDAMKEWE
jgi:integrase/recombinase XerD